LQVRVLPSALEVLVKLEKQACALAMREADS